MLVQAEPDKLFTETFDMRSLKKKIKNSFVDSITSFKYEEQKHFLMVVMKVLEDCSEDDEIFAPSTSANSMRPIPMDLP